MRIKLRDYEVREYMLYVRSRLYILNNAKLKIKIIKYIYNSSLGGYIDKSLTYNRVSLYYY